MVRAVIFDLDGVLVDSEALSFESYELYLKKYGITIDNEDRRLATGATASDDIGRLSKKYNVSFDRKKSIVEKEALYMRLARGNLKVFEGVDGLINLLRENRIKIAVASSGIARRVDFSLREVGLERTFDAVVTGDEVTSGKPRPEIFLKAAEKLKVNPSDCVVVEDSVVGIEAAKNAGMKCIAVTNTFPGEDLGNADIIVSSLSQVDIGAIKSLE